jgi:hypothetical protein
MTDAYQTGCSDPAPTTARRFPTTTRLMRTATEDDAQKDEAKRKKIISFGVFDSIRRSLVDRSILDHSKA